MALKKKKKVTLETLDARFQAIDKNLTSLTVRMDKLEESQRRTGMLLEQMHSDLMLLHDGYRATDERLDALTQRVDEGFKTADFKFERIIEMLDPKADKPASVRGS